MLPSKLKQVKTWQSPLQTHLFPSCQANTYNRLITCPDSASCKLAWGGIFVTIVTYTNCTTNSIGEWKIHCQAGNSGNDKYTRLFLNGHLYKTDTSVKRTLRVGPCLCLSLYFTLYKTDISLRRTLSAGPKGVRLGESWLYTVLILSIDNPVAIHVSYKVCENVMKTSTEQSHRTSKVYSISLKQCMHKVKLIVIITL